MLVGRIDEVAQPIVDELLRQTASLHIRVHINIGHLEAFVLQHRLNGDDIGMYLTPAERLDSGIDDVGTIVTYLEDRSHRESRTRMSVILDDNIRMLGLDALGEGAQQSRLSDTSHILQADFLSTSSNHLVGNGAIVLNGMHGAGGDTQRSLRNHASSLGPLDRGDDITGVVQTTEDTGDVHTLSLLDFVHQLAHIVGHGIHTKGVQATIQHVGLNAHLVEGFTESTNGQVGVLACHEVHLLESTTIGFHTSKASHVNNHWSNALQLVLTRLKFA